MKYKEGDEVEVDGVCWTVLDYNRLTGLYLVLETSLLGGGVVPEFRPEHWLDEGKRKS
jgi:hypothetical protein